MKGPVLLLTYAGCSTCKKAVAWLQSKGIEHEERPIVLRPPTPAELTTWIPRSGKPVRRWLNTSGQSYRGLGKAKIDAASDADLVAWLAADGKLVKRPVLVTAKTVLVGFSVDEWLAALT